MSNKGISVLTKIKLSLVFPVSLFVHCILFLADKNEQGEKWWKNTIYNIREEFDRDRFTIIGYSFFPLIFVSIIYILLYSIFKEWEWNFMPFLSGKISRSIIFAIGILLVTITIILPPKTKNGEITNKFEYSFFRLTLVFIIYILLGCVFVEWCRSPISFFSISLAIGALLISIVIALELKTKTVESGIQFINQLYMHINYLNHMPKKNDKKHELYIITPNVTIGTGLERSFVNIIKNNKNIQFIFICKTIEFNYLNNYPEGDFNEKKVADSKRNFLDNANKTTNNMLDYLLNRYHNKWDKLETSIKELKEILTIAKGENGDKNVEIIGEYDQIYKITNNEDKNIGGYLSDKECILGTYININAKDGEILFRGETITSPEFIEIVKTYMIQIRKITIESGNDFMHSLYKHIRYLNELSIEKGEKRELYVITPNITIGIGPKRNFAMVINENNNIQFKIICKTINFNSLNDYNKLATTEEKEKFLQNIDPTTNSMLKYMYERYQNRRDRLEDSIENLTEMLGISRKTGSNVDIIQKYDEIYKDKKVGGYLSDKECVLGTYEDIIIEEKKGKMRFIGETIISSEIINIIKTNMIEKIGI